MTPSDSDLNKKYFIFDFVLEIILYDEWYEAVKSKTSDLFKWSEAVKSKTSDLRKWSEAVKIKTSDNT